MHYAPAGILRLDNTFSERTLRLFAIGRNNWMFAGSDQRGHTAAILFLLTASCKQLAIALFAYLRDMLTAFPFISNPEAEHLDHWIADAWKQRLGRKPVERRMTGAADW